MHENIAKKNAAEKLYIKFTGLFKLQVGSHMRVYDGFGNDTHASINGHALRLSPLPRKKYRDNFLLNTFALIRMFMVQPKPNARIRLDWQGETHYTHS